MKRQVSYIVGVKHSALSYFTVTAECEEHARILAEKAFAGGHPETPLGNEYDVIERMFIETWKEIA